jgi:hypothetical protein
VNPKTANSLADGEFPMLEIRLAANLLIEAQESYRRLDTIGGANMALKIGTIRAMLRSQAESFNRRQGRQSGVSMGDGRRSSMARFVIDPYVHKEWPARSAAMLHGLDLTTALPLPLRPCRTGGATFRDLDPETYVARMDIGPRDARRFGDSTAWVAYLDAVNRLYVIWIGRTADAQKGLAASLDATRDFTDWNCVDPEYQKVLADRCAASSETS